MTATAYSHVGPVLGLGAVGVMAAGTEYLFAQAPNAAGAAETITSGTPGLWFAVGGIITALGTTIVQPWFRERNTQAKLDDALKRIAELESKWSAEVEEKRKAVERLAAVTDRNLELSVKLERLAAVMAVTAGRQTPGVPIDADAGVMIDDGPAAPAGPSVLLVEDDPQARAAVATILELKGFRVSTAPGLADALLGLDARPDFVLLDLMLPDGDGAELLRRVKRDGSRTQVIVTTGAAELKVAPVRALGPLALFSKPYDLNKIVAVMRGGKVT